MYFVHVSGTFAHNATYVCTRQWYICSEKFLIIVVLMYPVPSLTHMLNILDKFSMGVILNYFFSSI